MNTVWVGEEHHGHMFVFSDEIMMQSWFYKEIENCQDEDGFELDIYRYR